MNLFAQKVIAVVLNNEGGFQKHPSDPGNWTGPNCTGELIGTKYGIAARYFPNYDIPNLTVDEATEIYYTHWWLRMGLWGINNDELVLQVFDFGVNAGKRRSVRTIQRVVGAEPDGICGPITRGRINLFRPAVKKENGREVTYTSYDFFKQARKSYYIDLANRKPSMKVFLNGWLNRIEKTHF